MIHYKAHTLYLIIIRLWPNIVASKYVMIKAVITGDIVQSSKLDPGDKSWLIRSLKKTLKQWDKDFGTESEIYRGDSFQCLVSDPMYALRFALLIRTYIKSLNPSEPYDIYSRENPEIRKAVLHTNWLFDTRVAIGIGEVDNPMESVKTSDGEAFQLSGRKLDEIKNSRQMMAIEVNDSDINEELKTEIILLDHIVSRATALQCEVINLKLLSYTENKIAREFKIQQSAVNQRSNSSGWYAINTALERFETIYRTGESISFQDLIDHNNG